MRKSCHSEWSNQRATIIDALNVLVHLQGWMHGLLAARMTGFAASRDWSLLAAMLPLGIVFGSIHALTPGHGKSVLASYLVGSPLSALRSLLVAGVQALTHVGMAVVIALVALPLVSRSLGGVGRAPSIELLSRVLLVAVALWLPLLAWPQTRACRRGRSHGRRHCGPCALPPDAIRYGDGPRPGRS
jgi:ABC-type nickel/cobalt efflux system permease component RcnA